MADITCDCSGELIMRVFACKATDYGYPNKLIFMHPDGALVVAGDSPTLAEIQTGLADTGVDKLILIEAFTNGQRVEGERVEESGADTADGLTTVVSLNMRITGKIKLLSDVTITDLLTLNCQPRLRMWVITSQGYILGGADGYRTANFFTPTIMEGYGVANYIPVAHTYQHNLNATDPAFYDEGFKTLTNPDLT
jgi:hypothetical protein